MSEIQDPRATAVVSSSTNSIAKNNLDFCRFWLAIQVIFSHSFALADGNEHHEPLRIMTSGQIGSGEFAVDCFFATGVMCFRISLPGWHITSIAIRSPVPVNFWQVFH